MFYCTHCDKELSNEGAVSGHLRSKAHGGVAREDSIVETVVPSTSGEGEPVAAEAAVRWLDEPADADAGTSDRIAELERQLAEAEQRAAANSPFAHLPDLTTPDAVEAYFGADKIREMAELELASESKKRRQRDLPPLYEDKAQYAREVERVEKEIVQRRAEIADNPHRPAVANPMRMLKVIMPDKATGSYEISKGASIRQIPLESQIQGGRLNPQQPILTVQAKGAKIVTPLMCLKNECYAPARVERGKLAYNGYCSREDQVAVEGNLGDFSRKPDLEDPYTSYDNPLTAAGIPVNQSMTAAAR